VDVEIVLDQNDGLDVGEVAIGQVFQDVSVVTAVVWRSVTLTRRLAFERRKHHEEVGGSVSLVLVIATGRTSRFHRDRHARLREELL